MSGDPDSGGSGDRPGEVDETDRRLEEIDDGIDRGFDTLRGDLDDVRDDVGGVSGDVDDLKDEVQRQHERTRDRVSGEADATRDRVDDQHESTRGAVSDEAGATRDRVTDEHTRTRAAIDDVDGAVDDLSDQVGDEHEETRDVVRDQGQQTRDVTETTADETQDVVRSEGDETRARVSDVGDDVAALDGKLDDLTEEALQDLLDEKDSRREDNERLMERLIDMADSEYSQDQLDTILGALAKKDHKHNSDMAAVITQLMGEQTGEGFDHAAYQNWTGTTAQSYGLEGVDAVDMADAQDVRNVLTYEGKDGDFSVLTDPFQGVNAWNDKSGYGSVLRHTWTRLVDEVATYVAEQDARGADVSTEVQETVLTYLEEGGEALEDIADGTAHAGKTDRELAVLQHFDYAARQVDQHLAAGEYEQAVEALDAAYDTDQVAEVLDGDLEVGA